MMRVPKDFLFTVDLGDDIVILTWDRFRNVIEEVATNPLDSFDLTIDLLSDISSKRARKKQLAKVRKFLIKWRSDDPDDFYLRIRNHEYTGTEARLYAPHFIELYVSQHSHLEVDKERKAWHWSVINYQYNGILGRLGLTSPDIDFSLEINVNRINWLAGRWDEFVVRVGASNVAELDKRGEIVHSRTEEEEFYFEGGTIHTENPLT